MIGVRPLSLRFATLHKGVTYLIAGLGLFALTRGSELQLASVLLIAVGYAASWLVEEPLLSKPGYATFWNRAVLLAFAVQVVRGVLGGPLLALGIEYAAFLQLSRLAYRRTAREHQHVAVLAFLHLIAATVLTTGLDYALLFFGFVVVTPWMLALTHLRAEIEGNYRTAGPGGGAPNDVRRVLASRRVAGPGFLLGTALLAVPLFAATGALFLLFPRVGAGFLTFGSQDGQHVTGFGRNVRLGGFGVIRDDPTVVLRVKELDASGDSSAQRTFRLRGTSFDHYDGLQWTRTPDERQPMPEMFGHYPIVRWPRPGEDRRLRIVLDPLDEPVLFLPRHTVALAIDPRLENGRRVSRRLVRSPGLDIRYVKRHGLRLVYDAFVSDDPDDRHVEALSTEQRKSYLDIPDDHGRVVDLARELTEGAVSDRERAQQILSHLRDSGRYRYTLRQQQSEDAPPLVSFLFDRQAGHCEYFSTAMAMMLRAVGVPARNVTGFVGGEYNRYGDYYAIRQGDAHSWVEAYVAGRWVPFDPTPPGRSSVGPGRDLLSGMRDFLDALRVRWSNDVIGYDLRRQIGIFRDIASWLSWRRGDSEGAAEAGAAERHEGSDRAPPSTAVLWGALAAALLLLAGGWALRRRLRARRVRHPPPQSVRRAVALYLDLERGMRRAGRARPSTATPLEHAERLEREGFAAAQTVRRVTEAYLQARYGGRTLSAAELSDLRRSVRQELPSRIHNSWGSLRP